MLFKFYGSVHDYHARVEPELVNIHRIEDLRELLPNPDACGSVVVDFDPLHYGTSQPTIIVHDDYLVGGPLSCQD